MINPNEITNIKLKHVEKPSEKSGLDYKKCFSSGKSWFQLEKEKLSQYRQNQILAQLDQWVPLIPSQMTFDTEFIDIEKDVALVFIKYHEKFEFFHQNSGKHEKDRELHSEKEFVIQLIDSMKKDLSIQKLQQKIDDCRLWKGQKEEVRNPLFFKLSSRSPKDVTRMNDKNVDDLFEKDLKEYFPIESDRNNNSNRIVSFTRAATKLLQISSSNDVLELMLRSTRVYQDLIETYVDFWNDSSPTKNRIALREWDPSIDIRFEFRTFVVNSKLRACSQYNHVIYVEELEKYQNEIRTLIHNTTEYLQEHYFKDFFTTYVADFVIYPSFFDSIKLGVHAKDCSASSGEFIKLIELNPYEESTGTCLFSWKQDTHILPMPNSASLSSETSVSENNTFEYRFITKEFEKKYLSHHLKEVVADEFKYILKETVTNYI
ncbi:hypothetical protein C9374_009000 [Naegleria lovaniensis]|uniref:Cell division cycle protein 123 n=1 Tax=Naegleria lovaniensis TaxID=51637 RepID=A0AA88GJG0_NAELO|nr:uncharacterized protein C9374_009000 [Naegleria lovaniensis]KAG2377915.1 hypothetical protein C9374_009000 [Naegleria lovaniensis]